MKTNIQEINLHGIPEKGSGWWNWDETCDKCGKVIHKVSECWFADSEKPDTNETDFCINCMREFIDNNINYQDAIKMYRKDLI